MMWLAFTPGFRDQWSRLCSLLSQPFFVSLQFTWKRTCLTRSGFHIVKSGYGLWLPGDNRGSWSAAWDKKIGYYEPHMLHSGDPVRHRMAEERMKHDPVRLTDEMVTVLENALGECVAKSAGGLRIVAASIESTHMHLLIPFSNRNIDNTAKWIADQTTKAVHRNTAHTGPIWCKGKWRSYIFEESQWENIWEYIEQHNIRHGRNARPYSFLMDLQDV